MKIWRYILIPGLFALASHASALVVLQYHHVSDKTPKITSTPPELFEQHLAYLEKHRFNVLSIEKVAKLIRKGETLPRHAVVITFDDGFHSIYQNAFPLLKKRKWPFAVFVNSQAA